MLSGGLEIHPLRRPACDALASVGAVQVPAGGVDVEVRLAIDQPIGGPHDRLRG